MPLTLNPNSRSTKPGPIVGYMPLASNVEGHMNIRLGLGQPQVETEFYRTLRSSKNRLFVDNLNFFQIYGHGHFNGATARVYAPVNGKMKLWRTGTVTETHVNLEDSDQFNSSGVPDKRITTTSYQFELRNVYSDGAPIYFTVAAVDSAGSIGARSAWVAANIPNPSVNNTNAIMNSIESFTFNSSAGSLVAPNNVQAGLDPTDNGIIDITWEAVSGAAGYIIYHSWQDPTLNVTDEYMVIDGVGRNIPEGALVLTDKLILGPPKTFSAKVANSSGRHNRYVDTAFAGKSERAAVAGEDLQWIAYTAGDPAPLDIEAKHFMRVHSQGDFYREGFHGGIHQNFYDNLVPGNIYKARFLMRASAPITVEVRVEDATVGALVNHNVTTSWAWYEHDFSVSSFLVEGDPNPVQLGAPTGQTIDLAHIEIFDSTFSKHDVRPDTKGRLVPGSYLRFHQLIKGSFYGDMDAITNRTGLASNSFTTLYSHLEASRINNVKPWLQLEWIRPENDWLNFVAYLAAPISSGHPMALKRQVQGQTAPWVDLFEDIIFEFGNEAWQVGNIGFYSPPDGIKDIGTGAQHLIGQTYGMISQHFIDEMKKSPYWPQFRSKVRFYLGGRISNDFGTEAAAFAPDADLTGPATYMGGWESGQSTSLEDGASFLRLGTNNHNDEPRWLDRKNESDASGLQILTYEAGPGYAQVNSLPLEAEIAQEVVMKSRAAGTLYLDAVAIRGTQGYAGEVYFRTTRGDYWTSHASPGHGEGVFMSYGLVKMVYQAVGICEVTRLTTVQSPTRPLGEAGIDAIRAYEFKSLADPSNRVIAAINRNIDPSLLDVDDPLYNASPAGTEAMTITSGIASCTGLEYYANVGNFREHNRYPAGQRLNLTEDGFDVDPLCVALSYNWTGGAALANASSIIIDDTYGADAAGLPAANAVLLHMTGCVDV